MSKPGWKSELSLLDEYFGQKPEYPLATEIEHQAYEFHKQNEILKSLSESERLEIKNSTSAICGSLENGFSELYNVNSKGFNSILSKVKSGTKEITGQLRKINRNLEQINATLDWGFSALIEQLTLTNIKLDEIIKLLNIPDSQKQRKYHIEKGFEFLRKTKQNSFFFTKAKQNFEEAIKIEDSDYLSLQQLGIIHFYSEEFLNFEQSEKYFEQSILYSNSDINFSRNQQNPSTFHFTYNPSKITATSLMHLARLFSKKGDYKKAFNTALKGVKLYEMVGLFFDMSKYASALDDSKRTLSYLNKAISMDRYIAVKALTEELIKKKYVRDYLKNLEKKTTSKAISDIIEIKKMAHQNTIFKDEFRRIEILLAKKNYLESLKALEKIGYELDN